jgi:branched-chain amino acid transport system ATP-binding protein
MGISIVLVEHDMDLVMGIAEWVIVLDSGQKIAEGTASQIQKDKRVIAAYLGDEEAVE